MKRFNLPVVVDQYFTDAKHQVGLQLKLETFRHPTLSAWAFSIKALQPTQSFYLLYRDIHHIGDFFYGNVFGKHVFDGYGQMMH